MTAPSDQSDLISVPQGGGAIKGIGETFSPDLHTGTGNYSVPLELPPGRNGLQPKLSLVYSSGNGNGPLGFGWALDVPGVHRKTSKGIPRYGNEDVFILSGAEDLVLVAAPSPGETRYRPRTEGLFARIVHHTAGTDHWEVWSKDGLKSSYGTRRPSGAPADWHDPALVVNNGQIFAWRLTATLDPLGNRIEYLYQPGPAGEAQIYLSEVRYCDYGTQPNFLVSIRFNYEPMPEPFSDRRAGFEVRTSQRCVSIETWTNADAPVLARTVHLEYLPTPENGASLLGKIRVEGHDGAATQQMPPLEFAYTSWSPTSHRFQSLVAPGNSLPDMSLGHPDLDLIDIFGDGLLSVVQLNGVARYWRNTGNGQLQPPRSMVFAPPVRFGNPGVQVADWDGDGQPDLLVTDARGAGYYPLARDGGFDPAGYVRLRESPSFELTDRLVRLIDADGDGVTDAMRTGDAVEIFYNDRKQGFSRVESHRRGANVPDVSFDDPRVKTADFTGDGLTDIALISNGRVEYWPYLGYGRWGAAVRMTNSPNFPDALLYGRAGFDPRRLLAGDVNGDGVADLVYIADGEVTVWINRCGNGFDPPVTVYGTPPVSHTASVRLADMLGNGTAGVLWSYDPGAVRGSNYKFLDLLGGVKPYLLASIDNHMGATTTIEYAPSTKFAIADKRAGKPWQTTLPFPVQVVSRIIVSDYFSASNLVTEFDYHHGYWDGAEREFRGFGRTDHRDALSFDLSGGQRPYSPPTEVRTWFHQGPVGSEFGDWRGWPPASPDLDINGYWIGDPPSLGVTDVSAVPASLPRRALRDAVRSLRGSILRTELYAFDGRPEQGRPYTVEEHRFALAPVLDGRRLDDPAWVTSPVCFAYQIGSRATQWNRGAEPLIKATFTGQYDRYGQPQMSCDIAAPRHPGDPYLAIATRTAYASRDDDQRYIVNRVACQERVELQNDGSLSLFDMGARALAGILPTRVRALGVTFYDGASFEGMPFGQLGMWGLAVREEELVFTSDLLDRYVASGATVPPYLPTREGGPPAWTQEYPQAFRDLMPVGGGYTYRGDTLPYRAGWYTQTKRINYDIQGGPGGRGQPVEKLDPIGNKTEVRYDDYQLHAVEVTKASRLTKTATYDYRVLKPAHVTDVNGNRVLISYTPLGLPFWIAAIGKASANQGDSPEQPGTLFEYGLTAWDDGLPRNRQPMWVHTTHRVDHRWALVDDENRSRAAQGLPPLSDAEIAGMFPSNERDIHPERFLRKHELTDGFGRLLQARVQSDDTMLDNLGLTADVSTPVSDARAHRSDPSALPPVVVNGWTTYDNKGRAVEKYEPYFDAGWSYRVPGPAELATFAKVTVEYDPRDLAVRTLHPDGSEIRIVSGVPPDLANPDIYAPTPWESYTYDQNDNAGRTHPARSKPWQGHWNTPTSVVVDPLGRVLQKIERTDTALYTTSRAYDVDGNLVQVTDPTGQVVSTADYDLTKQVWRHWLLDAGTTWRVLDAAQAQMESRDDKGALVLAAFDALRRPIRHWACDRLVGAVTLREAIFFGDDPMSGLPSDRAAAANLLGRAYITYDEAGMLRAAEHDLDGNLVEKSRRPVSVTSVLSGLPPPGGNWSNTGYAIDWQPRSGETFTSHAETILDPTPLVTSTTYDAAGRRKSLICPVDVDGKRAKLVPTYSRAGTLTHLELDASTYIDIILHNAHGQRVLAVLGGRTMIRYVYDPLTFQLARLRAEPCQQTEPLQWHPGALGAVLQDNLYPYDPTHIGMSSNDPRGHAYDLVGNLIALFDRTPNCGVPPMPDQLDRAFTYEPTYRLVSATGRECDVPSAEVWSPGSRCFDITRSRAYLETYQYDAAGNMVTLNHSAGPGASSVRSSTVAAGTNRMIRMSVGQLEYAYSYDACGNVLNETTSRFFEWDSVNRLATFRTQAHGSDPSLYAQYRYDAAGQRVMKVVRNQGGQLAVTLYVDGVFERLILTDSTHDSVHLLDSANRVATVRVGAAIPGDPSPAVAYHLGDHLGSSAIVVDGTGAPFNREEYTPFGETSFGSYARKRYRYIAKERDEESGLEYHSARYYAAWLCRWVSCDPLGIAADLNTYRYAHANPLTRVDQSGAADTPKPDKPKVNQAGGTKPKPNARYAIDEYGKQQKIPQKSRTGGPNIQANHGVQDKFAKDNIAGYKARKAPTQFLATGKGQEHTAITNDMNAKAPRNWSEKSTSAAFSEAVEQYQNAGLMTDAKQGLPFMMESQGHLFTLNDKVVNAGTGMETVVKNAALEENFAIAAAKAPTRSSGGGFASVEALGLTALTGILVIAGLIQTKPRIEAWHESGDKVGEALAWGSVVPGPVGIASGMLEMEYQLMIEGGQLEQMYADHLMGEMGAREEQKHAYDVMSGASLMDTFSFAGLTRPWGY